MNILAIDCSTRILSVCLSTGTGRTEALLDVGLTHAERVMDLVDFCIDRSALKRADIDLLACAEGPGSFTGLRIGMATTKGLALGLDKPWVAVPTLDCLAFGLEGAPGAVVPVIDGKKGRLYAAIYHRGLRQGAWLDLPLAALVALLDTYDDIMVTGPDAELLKGLVSEGKGFMIDSRSGTGAARGMAALAGEIFASRGAFPDDAGPLYLRPSEAEETAAGKPAVDTAPGRAS
ncbi:MAG: tRNA (adenosine(37)-N6)-threonylcarbamoyltransferase complex dimerization subunit type 1 TsaB [Spirochaetota bacterium]